MKVYEKLGMLIVAAANCREGGNKKWFTKHLEKIEEIMEDAPTGSGVTRFEFNYMSDRKKLIFDIEYHHMNENGYYDGYTDHTLTVTIDFLGLNLKLSGKDKNGIKDYLYELSNHFLHSEIKDPNLNP